MSNSTASPADRTRPTVLDPAASYVTVINTYAVMPERAEQLLEFLVRSATETLRFVPGFVSTDLHLSLDRTQLVNYSQWRTVEAIAAARENPEVAALIGEAARIADSFKPVMYNLRQSIAAATPDGAGFTLSPAPRGPACG